MSQAEVITVVDPFGEKGEITKSSWVNVFMTQELAKLKRSQSQLLQLAKKAENEAEEPQSPSDLVKAKVLNVHPFVTEGDLEPL